MHVLLLLYSKDTVNKEKIKSWKKTKHQKIKFIPFNLKNTIRYGSYIPRSKIGNLRGDPTNKNKDGMMKSFAYIRYI